MSVTDKIKTFNALGLKVRLKRTNVSGEFAVSYRSGVPCTYFTDDIEDAISTGWHMEKLFAERGEE